MDRETLARLVTALANPKHSTKEAAAHAAGISYPTLARWQAEHPQLHSVWEAARRPRYERRQAAVLARAALRPARPAPTKQMRMVCWFLIFRVHPEHSLEVEHEVRACERVSLSWERWLWACEKFPALMGSVYRKRAQRLDYLRSHGSIGLNYLPPDPARPRDRRYPAYALYHWCRGNTFREFDSHEQAQSPRTGQRWL